VSVCIEPRSHQQQCRSNIVECYKSNDSFDKVDCCFDKVERCFDVVARGVNRALVELHHCGKPGASTWDRTTPKIMWIVWFLQLDLYCWSFLLHCILQSCMAACSLVTCINRRNSERKLKGPYNRRLTLRHWSAVLSSVNEKSHFMTLQRFFCSKYSGLGVVMVMINKRNVPWLKYAWSLTN